MKKLFLTITLFIAVSGLYAQTTETEASMPAVPAVAETKPEPTPAPTPEPTPTPAPEPASKWVELEYEETSLPDYLSECKFRAFIPPTLVDNFGEVIRPRAILIIVPGANGDGRNVNQDWLDFAEKEKLMVIGTSFKAGTSNYELSLGMGEVLEKGVSELNKLAKIDKKIPLLIVEHSAGGNVILSAAITNPAQMLALAIDKSAGFSNLHAGDPEPTYDIPTIFHIGGKDTIFKERPITRYWAGRENKALWTMFLDKDGGHESTSRGNELFRNFFSVIMEMRIGTVDQYNPSSTSNTSKPSKVMVSDGIFVSPDTLLEDAGLKKAKAIWVPNNPKFLSALRGS